MGVGKVAPEEKMKRFSSAKIRTLYFCGDMAYRSVFTVSLCQQKLAEYLEAETRVLSSQSYTIGGRSLTRANLAEIRSGIEIWSARLADAQAAANGRAGIGCLSAIPH